MKLFCMSSDMSGLSTCYSDDVSSQGRYIILNVSVFSEKLWINWRLLNAYCVYSGSSGEREQHDGVL